MSAAKRPLQAHHVLPHGGDCAGQVGLQRGRVDSLIAVGQGTGFELGAGDKIGEGLQGPSASR